MVLLASHRFRMLFMTNGLEFRRLVPKIPETVSVIPWLKLASWTRRANVPPIVDCNSSAMAWYKSELAVSCLLVSLRPYSEIHHIKVVVTTNVSSCECDCPCCRSVYTRLVPFLHQGVVYLTTILIVLINHVRPRDALCCPNVFATIKLLSRPKSTRLILSRR